MSYGYGLYVRAHKHYRFDVSKMLTTMCDVVSGRGCVALHVYVAQDGKTEFFSHYEDNIKEPYC